MTLDQIRNHIALREEELSGVEWLNDKIKEMHEESPFTEKTWREINAKISSRMAFLVRSIQDHEKFLPAP